METGRGLMEAVRERCAHCPGRGVSICNAVDDSELPALVAESSRVNVAAGRSFIEEGAPAHDFYVVAQGRAKLFNLMPDGRRQVVGFADVGDFLGLASSETYAFTAEALGDVTLCRFPHSALERLMVRFPRLRCRFQDEASSELVAMQARLMVLGRKTARERLASFLVEQVRPCRKPDSLRDDEGPLSLTLPMSRMDIADYLGLTIETVSRTFGALKREGLLRVKGGSAVTLLMPGRLDAIANGLCQGGEGL